MLDRHAVLGALAAVSLVICGTIDAQEKKQPEIKLDGIKCLFCKVDVSKEDFAEYKGARVFFGCAGCPQAFKKNPKKYATQANAQLVATGQARQKACPLSGRSVKGQFKLTVGKAEVAFCCVNCKQATEKLEGDAQLEKVFAEAAFNKAFHVPGKKDKK